jgi:hypothetical protein
MLLHRSRYVQNFDLYYCLLISELRKVVRPSQKSFCSLSLLIYLSTMPVKGFSQTYSHRNHENIKSMCQQHMKRSMNLNFNRFVIYLQRFLLHNAHLLPYIIVTQVISEICWGYGKKTIIQTMVSPPPAPLLKARWQVVSRHRETKR